MAAWAIFLAIMVFPKPAVPHRIRLRPRVRKSRVRARSIKGRSIFLGQSHSKSARGLKRRKRAWARRRSRLRRAAAAVSERAISSSSWRGLQRPVEARATRSSSESAVRTRPSCCNCATRSFVGIGVLGEIIVSLQSGIGNGQVFQIGTTREINGEGSALPPLAMAASQDKGHGRKARGVVVESLAKSGSQFCGAVVIEQAEEWRGEPGGRFAALEGGLQEGLTFRHQSGQTAGGRCAQGLAFLFEQGLAMGGVFDVLVAVVGAAMGSDFGRAVEQANGGGRSHQGQGTAQGRRRHGI